MPRIKLPLVEDTYGKPKMHQCLYTIMINYIYVYLL